MNAAGPEVGRRRHSGNCPGGFKRMVEEEVSARRYAHVLAFGGGHIEGALNIAASPILRLGGWFSIGETDFLVLDSDDDVEKWRTFVRTGYTKFAGYLSAECAPGKTPVIRCANCRR